MINRSYLVVMPTNPSSMTSLDILLRGPVGTVAAPVRIAAGGTTPPTNWQVFGAVNGDGQFCEWRGRPVPFSTLAADLAAGGFVPRLALGWRLDVHAVDSASDGCVVPPTLLLSASLIGTMVAPFLAMNLTDPAYGPVIRLLNSADVAGRTFVVNLGIAQQRDADRSATGL